MNIQADTNSESKTPCVSPRLFSRKKFLLIAVPLVFLSLLIVFERLHTYGEPMPPDVSADAVVAHELLAGKSLYTGVWNQKPPLIYMTYAALEALAGRGRGPIVLLSISVSILTLLGVYAAASVYGVTAGLWAAAFWAVIANDLTLQGNEPSGEVFLNVLLAWAFAMIVREGKDETSGIWRFFIIGILFALASLYKQNMVLIPALIMCVHIALPSSAKSGRAHKVVQAGVVGLTGIAAWAAVFGYFKAIGHFRAFYDAVFLYNHFYAGSAWGNISRSFDLSSKIGKMAFTIPLAALAVSGAAFCIAKGPKRVWLFLAAYAVGTHIAVAFPRFFYPHYYQLWLPVLAIGAGMSIGLFGELSPERYRWVPHATGAVVLALLLYHEVPFYNMTAKEWSLKKYGPFYVRSEILSEEVSRMLEPDETFFVWGYDPEIYFNTRHRPASVLFFTIPLHAGPLRETLAADVIRDLEKSRPELFIVNSYYLNQGPGDPVFMWFMSRYRFLSSSNGFLIYARLDGKLEKRWHLGPKTEKGPQGL